MEHVVSSTRLCSDADLASTGGSGRPAVPRCTAPRPGGLGPADSAAGDGGSTGPRSRRRSRQQCRARRTGGTGVDLGPPDPQPGHGVAAVGSTAGGAPRVAVDGRAHASSSVAARAAADGSQRAAPASAGSRGPVPRIRSRKDGVVIGAARRHRPQPGVQRGHPRRAPAEPGRRRPRRGPRPRGRTGCRTSGDQPHRRSLCQPEPGRGRGQARGVGEPHGDVEVVDDAFQFGVHDPPQLGAEPGPRTPAMDSTAWLNARACATEAMPSTRSASRTASSTVRPSKALATPGACSAAGRSGAGCPHRGFR